jgi:hypothetical protein
MTPKEQYYKYGESLGISINDLQRLKMLADNCQQDITNEIQSLIDIYNFKIDELLIDFNDGYSVITLTEISTFQDVVTNLKKLL